MIITDTYGYLGNLLFLIGAYGLAHKKIYGFITQFFANILYIAQSLILHNNPLLWLSISLGIFNLYGAWKWKIGGK